MTLALERAAEAGDRVQVVRLASPEDVDAALAQMHRLLADGVPPECVRWHDAQPAQAGLFDGPEEALPPPAPAAALMPEAAQPAPHWPADVLALVRSVLRHDAPERHLQVHRLLQRLQADMRHWHDRLHPERLLLERMGREVRREIHKMHAFVRFRPVKAPGEAEPRHVAWFEPAHHVLRAAAPFFRDRFAAMPWAILTPRGSVAWDRQTLHWGPPARREDAPAADAGEALWLAYYRSIFNPARIKPAMMRREMPVRFWRNLPEAAAIAPLLRDARPRTDHMVRHAADTARRLPAPPPRSDVDRTSEQARDQLRDLSRQMQQCDRCPAQGRSAQVVCGRGAVPARVMIVGEQPGDAEDLAGRPFVGPAGQWLQAAIAALGWPLKQLYVTNAVKHFHHVPRGKRRLHKTPEQAAIAACLDWLEAEVALVQPEVIVALGRTAAQALLGPDAPPPTAGSCRWRADGRPVHVLPHPASLLRAGHAPDSDASLTWRHRLGQCWPQASVEAGDQA